MSAEDLDRIDNIAFIRKDLHTLNRFGELNKSKVVQSVLEEFENHIKKSHPPPSRLTAEVVLQHLFRYCMENESYKSELQRVTGVSPHHSMPIEERVPAVNAFIGRVAEMKDDRYVSRMIDEFVENTEFMLHAHLHLFTEDFIAHLANVSPPAKDALKQQVLISVALSAAAPESFKTQRFMETFNELMDTEQLSHIQGNATGRLR